LPSAEGQYYSIDDNRIKHYILTPEISEPDNVIDDLTNFILDMKIHGMHVKN